MGKIRLHSLVARSQLNDLSVAGQSILKVLPKPSVSTTVSLDGGNCLVRKDQRSSGNATMFVPVVSVAGGPLMPCHPARARELLCKGKAVRRFSKGIFYIQLLQRSEGSVQTIAVGIDPGSKKEGFSVKSEKHTYLNIQSDAVTWVKDSVETKRAMRRSRRNRKTPCRKNRSNRKRGGLVPSTKARWQWKLRISKVLAALFPIECFVVEDIKAITKGKRKWDASFSPLEVGKTWFYKELQKLGHVELKQGFETYTMRNQLGLKKSKSKLGDSFDAHCVDSWVLANYWTGGDTLPENKRLFLIAPVRVHRRQLQVFQPAKDGVRKLYGGTRSLGFKRGSLVKHKKHGIVYVGGTSNGKISLHAVSSGKRICLNAKKEDCVFLTFNIWKQFGTSSPT